MLDWVDNSTDCDLLIAAGDAMGSAYGNPCNGYTNKNCRIKYLNNSKNLYFTLFLFLLLSSLSSSRRNLCVCAYDRKIPSTWKTFLLDQKSERKMFFDSIDIEATRRAERREQTHNGTSESPAPKRKIVNTTHDDNELSLRSRTVKVSSVVTKYIPLTNVARESQRFGISLSGTATLCNALLKDLNVSNSENLIDRSQIQRNVSKFNKNITDAHTQKIQRFVDESSCIGLFFDGKKDKSKTYELNEETGQQHPRTETEDHYSIVLEPNSMYYATITPNSSKAVDIAHGIFNQLKQDEIDVIKIKFFGCDATNVNTGEHGGKTTSQCDIFFSANTNFNFLESLNALKV